MEGPLRFISMSPGRPQGSRVLLAHELAYAKDALSRERKLMEVGISRVSFHLESAELDIRVKDKCAHLASAVEALGELDWTLELMEERRKAIQRMKGMLRRKEMEEELERGR